MSENQKAASDGPDEGTIAFTMVLQLIASISQRKVWDKLPSYEHRGGIQFARESLCVFSCAENLLRMWMLRLYPKRWTPQLSKEISTYWAVAAKCPYDNGSWFRLDDMLLRSEEKESVVALNRHKCEEEGGEEKFLSKKRPFEECYKLLQEARNIEVGLLARQYEPIAASRKDENYKISMALTACYLFWSYGDLKYGNGLEEKVTAVTKELMEAVVGICMGLKATDEGRTVDTNRVNEAADAELHKKKMEKCIWDVLMRLQGEVWGDATLLGMLCKDGREWHLRLGSLHLVENIIALKYRGLNPNGWEEVEALGILRDTQVRMTFAALMESFREEVRLGNVSSEQELEIIEETQRKKIDGVDGYGKNGMCSLKTAYVLLQGIRLHAVKEMSCLLEKKGAKYPGSYMISLYEIGKEWICVDWRSGYKTQLVEGVAVRIVNICNEVLAENK